MLCNEGTHLPQAWSTGMRCTENAGCMLHLALMHQPIPNLPFAWLHGHADVLHACPQLSAIDFESGEQVGQKRARHAAGFGEDTDAVGTILVDPDGKPRKQFRSGFPAAQFLTVYDHRPTQKQR